jgi:translation initiation factor 2B subunit (eIF-2B alpha/beta/delta family)
MRKFVLGASDLVQFQRRVPWAPVGGDEADVREFDYTPARFVTLLLTEKGPMPPTAVTAELTKLLGVS